MNELSRFSRPYWLVYVQDLENERVNFNFCLFYFANVFAVAVDIVVLVRIFHVRALIS